MGIENYLIQNDLYKLIQADVTDIVMWSDNDNDKYYIIHYENPSEKVYYPYNTKVDMEKDYTSLVSIIEKLF